MKSKRIWTLALGLILAGLTFSSCEKDKIKSLSELKDEQRSAIGRLISDKGLKIVERKDNTLPEAIDPAVYYHLNNGLYIRVLNQGVNPQLIEKGKTKAYVLLRGAQFTKSNYPGSAFDNLSKASVPPIGFVYDSYYNAGEVHFQSIAQTSPQSTLDVLMNEGIAFPLSIKALGVSGGEEEKLADQGAHKARIGHGARLSLIVPFEIGPQSTYSTGTITYIEEVEYIIK